MIIQVGEAIGVLPTIALLILDSVVGSWLMRSQGRLAWQRFTAALAEGRPPAREVLDGALVIVGGALQLAPGFVTDVFGFVPDRAAHAGRSSAGRSCAGWRAAARSGSACGRPGRVRPVAARRRAARRRTTCEGTATRGARPPTGCRERATTTAPRRAADGGFSDALTYAFADPEGDVCGVARHRASRPTGCQRPGLLFGGGEPVAVAGRRRRRAGGAWEDVRAAGLTTETLEPRRALARDASTGDGPGFDLEFEAIGAPAVLAADSAAGARAAWRAATQLCRVTRHASAARASPGPASAAGPGARPDWERMALARTADRVVRRRPRRSARCGPPRRGAQPRRRGGGRVRPRRDEPQSGGRRARISTTYDARGPPAQRRSRAVRGVRGRGRRSASPARSSRARRWTSAGCGWTARSSAGGWTGRAGRRALRRPARARDQAIISDFGGVLTHAAVRARSARVAGGARASRSRRWAPRCSAVTERDGREPAVPPRARRDAPRPTSWPRWRGALAGARRAGADGRVRRAVLRRAAASTRPMVDWLPGPATSAACGWRC